MTILGVDVSHHQNQPLPWDEWAGRVGVVVIQVTHGMGPEPLADGHLANTQAAGYSCVGAYHFLLPGNSADQALLFLAALAPAYSFAMLDVEADGLMAIDVAEWCEVFDQRSPLPLVLYGNTGLETLLGANNPRYAKYGVLVSDYGFFAPGTHAPPIRSDPPHDPRLPRVPNLGRRIGWQFAGNNGRLSPYTGAIDLSIWDIRPNTLPHRVIDPGRAARRPADRQAGNPAVHVWTAGDVALAVANPLTIFNAPNGTIHDERPNFTSNIDVFDISADGVWLKVFILPELWVRVADVKPRP